MTSTSSLIKSDFIRVQKKLQKFRYGRMAENIRCRCGIKQLYEILKNTVENVLKKFNQAKRRKEIRGFSFV